MTACNCWQLFYLLASQSFSALLHYHGQEKSSSSDLTWDTSASWILTRLSALQSRALYLKHIVYFPFHFRQLPLVSLQHRSSHPRYHHDALHLRIWPIPSHFFTSEEVARFPVSCKQVFFVTLLCPKWSVLRCLVCIRIRPPYFPFSLFVLLLDFEVQNWENLKE